ncbi:MAG: OmpA family protein [Fulvivirga sp.]
MKTTILTIAGMFVLAYGIFAQSNELENINSKKVEFSPSLSAEGNYIVFQSDRDASSIGDGSEWKLYNAHLLEDSTWSNPVEISNINNNVAFVAGPSLSYDGNTLYFTAFIEGKTESEDIFYSKKVGDTWSEPINIDAPINTPEMFEGFPSVSSDENAIYFIRVNEENPWDRKSKENCFSIYVSHKGDDGAWQEPVALPAPINIGCERSPRIMADNKTLIFSSIREGGQGSFDLYQSTLIAEDQWSEPVPFSFINTKESDLSPSIPASGDVVYYNASEDIVKADVPENFRQAINITVNGLLTDKNKNAGIKGKVEVLNPTTGETVSTHNTNEGTGRYSLVLQSGNIYDIRYTAENYDPYVKSVDLSEVETYEERVINAGFEQLYHLNLVIKDAELPSMFPATILVRTNEANNLTQTLEAINNNATIDLPVGLDYDVFIQAKNYHDDTLHIPLQHSPSLLTGERTVAMHPKKVPVSISLGNMGSDRSSRKIKVQNERTGEVIEADANQILLLRSGDRYKVIVNSEKGYAFASDEIDLTDYDSENGIDANGEKIYASTNPNVVLEEKAIIALNIPVTKLTKGAQITLKNILFETNSAELANSSFGELDQLVDMLSNNPGLIIEIAAHTDDVGSDAINLELSQRRAQSVADYLLLKEISTNRYKVKGYGESKPKVSNSSDENRAINRRVEFVVIE